MTWQGWAGELSPWRGSWVPFRVEYVYCETASSPWPTNDDVFDRSAIDTWPWLEPHLGVWSLLGQGGVGYGGLVRLHFIFKTKMWWKVSMLSFARLELSNDRARLRRKVQQCDIRAGSSDNLSKTNWDNLRGQYNKTQSESEQKHSAFKTKEIFAFIFADVFFANFSDITCKTIQIHWAAKSSEQFRKQTWPTTFLDLSTVCVLSCKS